MSILCKLNAANHKDLYDLANSLTIKKMLRIGGCVYVDTDSVKYVGDVDWSEFNARCIEGNTKTAHARRTKAEKYEFYGHI